MKQKSFAFNPSGAKMTQLEKSARFATLLAVTLELQQAIQALATGQVEPQDEQAIAHMIVAFIETTYQPAEA
tara:strand:+ start:336 stop:551 length:216 start_codon:yes stop_codon:yes gene_type:complete